jgi:hypothetical protein
LSFDVEFDGHHGALGLAGAFGGGLGIACDGEDFGFFENGRVKLRRLFGIAVEPEKGSYFLHVHSLVCVILSRNVLMP